jgi:hypothetical protein
MNDLFVPDVRRQITLAEAETIFFDSALPRELLELPVVEQQKVRQQAEAVWRKFKRKVKAGDEVWEFRSPPEKWRILMGQHGFEIVRESETIDTMFLFVN